MTSDITVRVLTEDDWAEYKDVRLEALRESPEAFVATLSEESELPETEWRDRMNRSVRLVASHPEGDAERDIGVASLGKARGASTGAPQETDDRYEEDLVAEIPDTVGEVFGMWVHPDRRGSGAARALIEAAARTARDQGDTHIVYWVGSDNGRAVAFASGIGFRPTGGRRPMGVPGPDGEDEDEVAMILVLNESAI